MTDAAILGAFEARGLLRPAEAAFARMLDRRAGPLKGEVLLAAAFACRAPRAGNVCVRLAVVEQVLDPIEARVADAEEEGGGAEPLPWPDPATWARRTEGAVRVVGDGSSITPLVLSGDRLYLHRYWEYERRLAGAIAARLDRAPPDLDRGLLASGLRALFPSGMSEGAETDWQLLAAAAALLRNFAVISGGPGTGKTTTLKRIVALVLEQAAARGAEPPRILLMAPTGKAAARMREALRGSPDDVADLTRLPEPYAAMVADAALSEGTIHRGLGVKHGNLARFWRTAEDPLEADLVVLDEASMVDVALMTKLVEAVPPTSRLVLVGDRHQLASVEAGAVLGDICAAAGEGELAGPLRSELEALGAPVPARVGGEVEGGLADCVVHLKRNYRFDRRPGIRELAQAINAGDAAAALAVLADEGLDDVTLVAPEGVSGFDPIRARVQERYGAVVRAARSGKALEALEALERFRVLCAHRRGRLGVESANERFATWLREALTGFRPVGESYIGRALMVQQNDYDLSLFNGDVGVIVRGEGSRPEVSFRSNDAGGQLRAPLAPARLSRHETVWATTIHKSQGSQFEEVVVVLPAKTSAICTRELLYTAVTRASERVTVIGSEEVVREAIERKLQRQSGLAERLAGVGGG